MLSKEPRDVLPLLFATRSSLRAPAWALRCTLLRNFQVSSSQQQVRLPYSPSRSFPEEDPQQLEVPELYLEPWLGDESPWPEEPRWTDSSSTDLVPPLVRPVLQRETLLPPMLPRHLHYPLPRCSRLCEAACSLTLNFKITRVQVRGRRR